MKYTGLIILSLTLVFQACGPKTQDAESIRQEINKHKAEITQLESKISELESQLEADSTYDANGGQFFAPVITETLQKDTFNHFFEVGGTVEAVHEAYISPEINGRIDRIYVKEGQFVSRGTLLVRLNSDITQSSIDEVETNLDLAKVMYKKQKELWDQNIGSEVQYLQAKSQVESLEARLKTMKAQLAMTSIRAPFSGIIDEIFRKEGEMAVPGVQLIRLVNLKDVLIRAEIAETYINNVKKGDLVDLEFPSYDFSKKKAKVSRTGNVINTTNRTFPIEVKLQNRNNLLKPNSMAVVHINDYTNPDALSVPSIILKQDVNKGFFLFVVSENEKGQTIAEKRYVEPGESFKGKTEILSGLEEGETVIVEGYNTVANGTPIVIE